MQINYTHPISRRLNVVTIPQDAPEEVKQIIDSVAIYGVISNPRSYLKNEAKLLNVQLKIAEKLQAAGYNPLEYGINIEIINKQLQNIKAAEEYRKTQAKLEGNIDDDVRNIDMGINDAGDFLPGALISGWLASPAFVSLSQFGMADPLTKAFFMLCAVPILFAAITGAGTLAGIGQAVVSTVKLLVDKCKLMKHKSLSEPQRINVKPAIAKASELLKVSELLKSVPKAIVK